MDFQVFEERCRKINDYSDCDNYEHMYDCASNDVNQLLPIVEWVKELEPITFRLAVTALLSIGFVDEASRLEKWLAKKPD